jgi:ABC-2 type transport system ATP-binding protein
MIEILNLVRRYGNLTAVDGLSLSVPSGELFCFLGPNGAGKTTTIKVLTGLIRPTAGTVLVAGFDIQREPLEAKRRIGYIPDMPYLYDRLTATEYVEFVGDLYRIPRSTLLPELERLFSLLGLDEYRSALVKDLSHGYRQRLIYAATLVHDPKVLFVDEPLIGLDPRTIRLIKELLKQKARAGMTIFLTTHILALAEDIADRVGIICNGRMIALGSLPELRAIHGDSNLENIFLRLTASEDDVPGIGLAGRQPGAPGSPHGTG